LAARRPDRRGGRDQAAHCPVAQDGLGCRAWSAAQLL